MPDTKLVINPTTSKLDKVVDPSQYVPRTAVNGSFVESFDALVTATTGPDVITMSLEQSGTGDLTMQFSDGLTTLDCTPTCEIVLTDGTDSTPQKNYIYILQSDKILTKSTSDWPATEHIKIAYFLVPSATHVDADGCYINQNWNDHLSSTDEMGHLLHVAEHIRRTGAVYFSGLDPTGTDDSAASSYMDYVGAAESYFKFGAGVAYQLHSHIVPAFDSVNASEDIHVANWNADNYHEISNLADIVADSAGVSLANKYFNVFFFVVANKTGEYAPVIAKLPAGSYATQSGAENDTSTYDDTTMPREFSLDSSTGIPICRMTLKWTGGTSTLTHISTTDLRTNNLASAGGGGGWCYRPWCVNWINRR